MFQSQYKTSYALILAAGKGTRMPSRKPKVLQTLLGDSMLSCVYACLNKVIDQRIFTLVGYEKELVKEELSSISQEAECMHIVQTELLGTGHALLTALPHFVEKNAEYIIVINGDVPLVATESIEEILNHTFSQKADLVFATIEVDDVAKYGRVVRNADSSVHAIVEAKDYDEEKYGKPSNEINAGLYIIKRVFAEEFLPKINNENASGEYYITDLIGLGIKANKKVLAYNYGKDFRFLGANNPLELSFSEEYLRKERNNNLLEKGVLLHNPETITIAKDVEIEAGAEIFACTEIYGKTKIGKYTTISSHCYIKNAEIAEDVTIHSYSHIEKASVASNCKIGPYARLRPLAELEEDVHIGNFVEVKKALVKKGAKANHLTYIGDAEIGERTNVGAGTITCNYDGVNKFKTTIGDDCFIGSNTALVAPVTLANKVLIGAGSVITKDVEENRLALTRTKQAVLARK